MNKILSGERGGDPIRIRAARFSKNDECLADLTAHHRIIDVGRGCGPGPPFKRQQRRACGRAQQVFIAPNAFQWLRSARFQKRPNRLLCRRQRLCRKRPEKLRRQVQPALKREKGLLAQCIKIHCASLGPCGIRSRVAQHGAHVRYLLRVFEGLGVLQRRAQPFAELLDRAPYL